MAPRRDVNRLTPEQIARCLRPDRPRWPPTFERPGPAPDTPRNAAVLLPMFRLGGRWRLLFIRRAEHPDDRHSGEVSFPGGRHEPGDADAAATALREAHEEIGLAPSRVTLLGQLGALHTVSNYRVTPVVGHLRWPQDLRPAPREVARIFSLPLDWLATPAHRRERIWPTPDHPQARRVVFFDQHDGERLWGVSAQITLDLLAALARDGI